MEDWIMRNTIHHTASVLLLAAVFALSTDYAWAQGGIAHGGPDGIYVDLGNYVLPAMIGRAEVHAYRVERRIADTREWSFVQDVRGPQSLEELESALQLQHARFGELPGVKINAPELWQRLRDARELRDIGVAARLLPVQLALGVRMLDSGAERASLYEYRISHLAGDGSVSEAFITPAVVWPGIGEVADLTLHSTSGERTSVTVEWRVQSGIPPTTFRVFRREGITGPYSELSTDVVDSCCYVSKTLTESGDTLLAIMHDKTVQNGLVYQYYATPQDFFFNEGRAGDTATVVSFRMSDVALPERMKIASIDDEGLLLRWDIRERSAVHGIVIERGPKIDSGFVELFIAAPTDTNFLDMSVTPMTRYYYRLRLIGPGGLRSPASAVVIGIWKSGVTPLPPQNVMVEEVTGGVALRWDPDTLQFVESYYVFRADGYGSVFQQISPSIPSDHPLYTDTATTLRGDMTYLYTVVAVTSSHMRSEPSDTVYATPDISVPVRAPQGLTARVDRGRVYLSWTGQDDLDVALSGYRVFRREGSSAQWHPMADTLLDAWQNHLLDEQTTPGERYAYHVRAYSIRGDSSATSDVVQVAIPLPEVHPPSNLKAVREGSAVFLYWDEIVQTAAKEFRVYRYTRGTKPLLLGTLPLDMRMFRDERPGSNSPVFYYITTVANAGYESSPGKEVAVILR